MKLRLKVRPFDGTDTTLWIDLTNAFIRSSLALLALVLRTLIDEPRLPAPPVSADIRLVDLISFQSRLNVDSRSLFFPRWESDSVRSASRSETIRCTLYCPRVSSNRLEGGLDIQQD